MKRQQRQLEQILVIADGLGPMLNDVVFVGGAVVGLLLTDLAAPDVRPTDDIDLIVSATTYGDYVKIQERLRNLKFIHDINGPQCRFTHSGITVDVMPSEENVLGFSNKFYTTAIQTAIRQPIDGRMVPVISAPVFLCTKLAAFNDRGQNDLLAINDMTDIIAVIDGRQEIVVEVAGAELPIRQFLSSEFVKLLSGGKFVDAIAYHLLPDEASQKRSKIVMQRITALSSLGDDS